MVLTGGGGGVVQGVLGLLCVLLAATPPGGITAAPRGPQQAVVVQGQRAAGRELWLDDFTKDFLDEMQSDGVGGGRRTGGTERAAGTKIKGRCPPPFRHVPRDACRVLICRSDTECHAAGHKCCNNGCTFTCMAAMPPPPLVDWKKEPRRKEKGISWLIPSTNHSGDLLAEHCSTTRLSSDEDMLLCPHGYLCHIEFLGDATRGIPNRGRCVPDVHAKPGSAKTRFRIRTEATSSGRCTVPSRGTYQNGAQFRYENHHCTCDRGSVECRVGRRRA